MFKGFNRLVLRVVLALMFAVGPFGVLILNASAEPGGSHEITQITSTPTAQPFELEEDECSGTMWTNGPLDPGITGQVKEELERMGINATVEARGYGETDRCGAYTQYGVDFKINLIAGKPEKQLTQQMLAEDILPVLLEYGQPNLGNVTIVSPQGEVSRFNTQSDPSTLPAPESASLPGDAITKNVYVIVFDPLLDNGQNLSDYMNWNDHATITQQTIDFFRQASIDQMNFTVVDTTIVVDRWPELIDGFSYSEEEYLAVLFGQQPPHTPTEVDYNKFVNDPAFDICGKLNRSEIDEVWVYNAPWFGFYESRLVGVGGYKYNSNPVTGNNDCAKLLPIMGPSVERAVDEAIHNFTHRAEATMTRVYGSWAQNRTAHNWDKFGLVKAQSPDYSYSGCGSSHYPPNGVSAYDYSNPSSVLSNCDDFANYPDLGDPLQVSQSVSCTAWGCTGLGYYEYWFKHFPFFSDCGPDDVANSWWKYFADPGLALVPLLACTPPVACPTITGWQGEYWNNRLMIGLPAVCRNDPNIDFDLGAGSPASLIYVDNFSARWERSIHFKGGSYRFYMLNDDGAYLYIDDVIQIDAWDTCCSWRQVDVPLSAGDHTVRMEMFEYNGGAVAKLWWEVLGSYSPEIDLRGNNISIMDGDNTPSFTNHTDFDSVLFDSGMVSRTFTIHNIGESTLNLPGSPKVVLTGQHATDFTVAVQPASQITASGSTTFTIVFNPGAVGLRTASVSIPTNDADENPFNFMIQGRGLGYPNILSITRAGSDPTGDSSVDFNVVFSENVTGVETADFYLITTGVTGAFISGVDGSGTTYIVTVDTGAGDGTIRLNLTDDNSIQSLAGYPLGGPNVGDGDFTSGELYTVDKAVLPAAPTGALTEWDKRFSWTGLPDATWYLLEVQTSAGTQVHRQWYTSVQTNCSGGTACSVTPAGLNLANGDYKWRVMDYGAYGYGTNSAFLNFTLDLACYTLTTSVNPAGGGTVNASAQTCAGGYTAGTQVQVTAVSNSGYVFDTWSGAASGSGNPVSVTMDGDKSLTANFEATLNPLLPSGTLTEWDKRFSWTGLVDATWYLLEVQTSAGTQVHRQWYTSAQTNCSGGTACSVTPAGLSLANGGYKWRVMDYGAYGYGANSAFLNFTLDLACYTLTTSVNPAGGGTVNASAQTCAGGYTEGSLVQVTAVPNSGYVFDTWSGAASGSSNPISVTMDGDKSLTANFEATLNPLSPSGTLSDWDKSFSWTGLVDATWYLLEVQTSGGTQVHRQWYTSAQTNCSGGTACSVTPAGLNLANGGYKWRVMDYGAYGYGTNSAFLNFTLDLACYTLTTNVNPAGGGTVNASAQNCAGGYTEGSLVQVTAVPNSGYVFDTWSGAASGSGNPVSVTMDGDKSLTANFEATVVLIAPQGEVSGWDNRFSWTGLSNATWYLLEVYNTGGPQVHRQWYTSTQAGCAGGTACGVTLTAGLADGDYRWYILDYGGYGYGAWTPAMEFSLNQ